MDKRVLIDWLFLIAPWVSVGLCIILVRWKLSLWLKALLACCIALGVLAGWMRYVEPFWIKVQEHRVEVGFNARIAVVADFHLGMFKDEAFLANVVQRLNALENIDFIAIPGDFTYYPDQPLDQLFAPLGDLERPAFAVLGNHDVQRPGPPLRRELARTLAELDVRLLENQTADFQGLKIVGLGDRWAGEDQTSLLNQLSQDQDVITLFHNPDTSIDLPQGQADLSLAGHTHGGQVRIPWLYKKVIPSRYGFDKGLYELPTGKLFITSGVGETAITIRLFNRAVIDVVTLY